MIQNIGTVDRVFRILVGVALIAAALLGTIEAWGWLGVIPLATGLFRFCPAPCLPPLRFEHLPREDHHRQTLSAPGECHVHSNRQLP